MGFVLDGILKKIIVDGPVPVIGPEYTSDDIDIDNRESEFAVQMDYDGGSSVNMNLYLQGSVDGVTFADISAPQNIVTDDGTHIWDVSGTGMSFLRVRIEVLGGSMNIQKIIYSAKRRH